MGLFDDFDNMATELFNEFGDFIDTASITRKTSTKDTSTGIVTVDETTYSSISVARRDYKQEETTSTIMSGDVEIKILANTISVAVSSNDILLISSGEKYNIVEMSPVPVNRPIVYVCQCRQKSG